MMQIQELTSDDEERYLEYLASRSDALLYYSWRYKSFIEALLSCCSHYLAAVDGDAIVGVMPLMHLERDGQRVYNALPFFGSHGDIIADSPAAGELLANAYAEFATADTTIAATVIENPFAQPGNYAYPHTVTDHRLAQYTMIDNLDPEEGVMPFIDSSARRNIQRAAKTGVTVSIESECMADLQRLHLAGMQSIGGTPKSDAFFDLLPRHFRPHIDYDIYVARLDGEIVAALLILYFGGTVEYFVPATDERFRSAQPLPLILRQAMEDAAARGFKVWNWGGTWDTQTGVYRFKRKWGAQEKSYRYFTQLNAPSILTCTPEQILQKYPNFFVVPFNLLTSSSTGEPA